jgi:osomolarity two-component system response regulator SSK1
VSQPENRTSALSTSHAHGPDVRSSDPLRVTNIDALDVTHLDRLSNNNSLSVVSDAAHSMQPDASVMTQPVMRKIWVKRPSQSATLVQIREDDLVDDVRDMILRKYANSLGRTIDSPDMTLRILMRPNAAGLRVEHVLGPEEEMIKVIEKYFPDGQKVADALLIDVPQKRTPRPSPRGQPAQQYYSMDDYRPMENGNDYFPPMAEAGPSNISLGPVPGRDQHNGEHGPRSISVITTGQIAPIPSPGAANRRPVSHRPKYARQHTSSPGVIQHTMNGTSVNANVPPLPNQHRTSTRGRADSSASEANRSMTINTAPPAPPLPSPPAPLTASGVSNTSHPPTPSGNAHRNTKPRRVRRTTPEKAVMRRSAQGGADGYAADPMMHGIASMLDTPAPPINVLIVEDNSVNLRVMEGIMKRLKVRWQTAVNGKIAVDKWRKGGFHLVVMDIQMPIMNGLQATKEIRRLERVNGIGVFSSSAPSSPTEYSTSDTNGKGKDVAKEPHNPEDDELPLGEGLFKSPVIIVALTASALQSDRHQALAAGCNDFLTKPVSFHWLERKIKEWGCMQALIDFDGWRKWRDVAAREAAGKTDAEKAKEKEQDEKARIKAEKLALLAEKRERLAAEKATAAAAAAAGPSGTSSSETVTVAAE